MKKLTLNLNDIICERNRELSDADIQSMAASIGNVGLLNPLILHKLKDGRLKVAAARTRYFALMSLARYELPPEDYKIINTDDADLISFIENFERRQLSLLEEAEQIGALMLHHDVAELATILGRSDKYVRFRNNINKLTDAWKKSLSADEYPYLKAGHYEAISRFPESVQKEIKTNYYFLSPGSVKEFTKSLDEKYSHILNHAIFDISKCSDCEKNSNKQPWLFEELKDDKDCTCLDPECWNRKLEAYIKKEVKDIQKNKKDITLVCNEYNYDKKAPYAGAVDLRDFEMIEIDVNIPERNAFIVSGDSAGSYCEIRLNDKPSTAPPQPKTVDEKRQLLTKRRVKKAILNLYDNINEIKDTLPRPENDELLKLSTQLLINNSHVSTLDNYEKLKVSDQRDMLWKSALSKMLGQLHNASDYNLDLIDDKTSKAVCKILGLDWKTFVKDATKEIKTPKSLED